MTEIPGFDMSEIKQWTCTWVGIIAIKNNGGHGVLEPIGLDN